MNEESLFYLALEKSAGERAAFLEAACGNDAALRGRVSELLDAHEDSGSFFGGSNANLRENDVYDTAPIDTLVPNKVIGPYRLLQQIGEGGFGVVFMAEQQRPVR